VAVLGGGPCGLWTALELLSRYPGLDVSVLEREHFPGGLAGSFRREGLVWDLGSHRLHSAAPAGILDRARELLGDRFLTVPRNGRILLEGRFLRFPLRPVNAMLRLPPSFAAGILRDAMLAPFRREPEEGASFGKVMEGRFGRTISGRFYGPYAEKLWGFPADELDGEQARRRVASGSLGAVIGRTFSGRSRRRSFHYPRGGFGALFAAAAERIESRGGRVITGAEVNGVTAPSGSEPGKVSYRRDGLEGTLQADFIFSTLPITRLAAILKADATRETEEAAGSLGFRSMVLLFLRLGSGRFTPFDAHYFPGPGTCFSRVSERLNYEAAEIGKAGTGICLEIPCWKTDPVWSMDHGEIAAAAVRQLAGAGLPRADAEAVFTTRISEAYPSYPPGWRRHFDTLDRWLQEIPGLVSLGRQGLFVHDNVHHAMGMGVAGARCLDPVSGWDRRGWADARKSFLENVVED
jgi:protoporphyrinogen oxidase